MKEKHSNCFRAGLFFLALAAPPLWGQQNWTPSSVEAFAATVPARAWEAVENFPITRTNALWSENGILLALGSNGILRSTNGETWTRVATTTELWAVTAGNNLLVAVGRFGTILLSDDEGVTWQTISAITNQHLHAAAFGGGRFWAAGAGGIVLSSTNGYEWSAGSAGGPQTIRSAAYGNGRIVVAGDQILRSSANGAQWSAGALSPASTMPFLREVIFAHGRFIAVGDQVTAVSSDGQNWTVRPIGLDVTAVTVANGLFYAMADGHLLRGWNGLDWEDFGTDPVFPAHAVTRRGDLLLAGSDGQTLFRSAIQTVPSPLRAVAFGSGAGFVAAGHRHLLAHSADGLSWTPVLPPESSHINAVTRHAGFFWGVGGSGRVLRSADGLTWTAMPRPGSSALTGLAGGPAGLAVTSVDGSIFRSVQGEVWEKVLPVVGGPLPAGLLSVAYVGGRYVAVGYDGEVWTSSHGQEWVRRHRREGLTLSGVAFGHGRYLAAGRAGSVVASGDGETWHEFDAPLPDIRNVVFFNNVFVASGWDGAVWLSYDGWEWEDRSLATTAWLDGIAFSGSRLVAVGEVGKALTSLPIPVIQSQPVSLILEPGAQAAFSVAATGAGPLHYAWHRNGAAIPGATHPSFSLPNVTLDDAARLRVAISNEAGTIWSRPAVLVVLARYQGWLEEAGFSPSERVNPAVTGLVADPGGYGVPNLLRFALGLDPRLPEVRALPREEIRRIRVEGVANDYLTLTFTHRPGAADAVWVVEASSNLVDWEDLGPVQIVSRDSDGQRETVTVRDSHPVSATPHRRFLRLVVRM
jgi:hypothetical protein